VTITATHTAGYTRTHTAAYVADKLRGLLSELIRDYGLDPKALHDAWTECIGEAARLWMASGHLEAVCLEFHLPGSSRAAARWDFPVRYDGPGVDDLWVDKSFFRDSIAKGGKPPAGCLYRIVLQRAPGAPKAAGLVDVVMMDTSQLTARDAGTVISTPDIYARARYYR